MSKHTPGPWKHETYDTDQRGTGVIWSQRQDWEPGMLTSPNGKVVAEVKYSSDPHRPWRGSEGDEFEANARLISAAPAMVDALRAVVAGTTGNNQGEDDEPRCLYCSARGDDKHQEYCFMPAVEAAIAKAEGRE